MGWVSGGGGRSRGKAVGAEPGEGVMPELRRGGWDGAGLAHSGGHSELAMVGRQLKTSAGLGWKPAGKRRRLRVPGRALGPAATIMRKVNTRDVPEERWTSPRGKFAGSSREISVALGRKPHSTDLRERHPFDVELTRVPAGKDAYPYHAHSAQWEFYHVVSGRGVVRHAGGTTAIEPGDAFLFEPGQAHQITNTGDEDLVFYTVADNPVGESVYYPDSGKWLVRSPERRVIRSEGLDYFDGEE